MFTLDPGGTVLPNSSVTYIQSIPNTTNAWTEITPKNA